jgi:Zn ribbon nucleic-acid-binding protein
MTEDFITGPSKYPIVVCPKCMSEMILLPWNNFEQLFRECSKCHYFYEVSIDDSPDSHNEIRLPNCVICGKPDSQSIHRPPNPVWHDFKPESLSTPAAGNLVGTN